MICPRCSVAELSPLTGVCELCGYSPEGAVAVDRADPIAELAQRQLAHEFTFGDLLGRGARSTVFRVREKSAGRSVILKVMKRRTEERDAEESFRGTLGAFAQFDHPHLVPVLRFGSTDSLFWFASADVEGTSLRAMLHKKEELELRTVRRITTQIVSALDFLHRRGVVHGAIKPENVLLDKDGWVRLCDPLFVRARPQRTSRGAMLPAPRRSDPVAITPRLPWVAPEEHARGERTPAADQFAVAALVHESLTGHPPNGIEELATLRPDLPPHVVRAIARALSEDPPRRFVSCTDFLGALEDGAGWQPESRASGRTTEEVVLIKGWEAPPDPGKPLAIAGRVAVLLIVAGALYFSGPTVIRALRPAAPNESRPTPTAPPAVTTSPAPPSPETLGPTGVVREGTPPRTPVTRQPTRPTSTRSQRAATPAAPAPVNPRLFINSSPWGQVYLDGELLGNTPRPNIEVTPGQHVIRVVRTGFAPFERTMRLAAGDTLRLTDIVLEPARP